VVSQGSAVLSEYSSVWSLCSTVVFHFPLW